MSILSFLRKRFVRKAFRKSAQFNIKVVPLQVKNKCEWTQSEYFAEGCDISPKGLRMDTFAPLVVGDRVHLSFALRQGSKVVNVDAISRNQRPGDGGKITVGIEFLDPKPEVVKYLSTILLLYK